MKIESLKTENYVVGTKEMEKSDSSKGENNSNELSGKRFTCEACGKEFRFIHVFQDYMRIHTGEKPFQCKTCNKRFPQQGSLYSHEKIHNNVKTIQM